MRRLLLVLTVFSSISSIWAATAQADNFEARAKKLAKTAIIIDGHLDAPSELTDKWADISDRDATHHFDLPRAREGGLTAPFFSIFVSPMFATSGGAKEAMRLIDLTRRVVDAHPKEMMMAASIADVKAAKKAGKLGVLMGIEGGYAIEDSLAVLREMYRAGVRYMTLTHVAPTNWADSSGFYFMPDFDPKKNADVFGGLSDFGKEVVKEMNRIGMIVDVSHVADSTVDDVLEVSSAPVMASHSSCRAITDMPRNLTDDQIKRIAAKGGIVMINAGSLFIDQKAWDGFNAMKKRVAPQLAELKKKAGANMGMFFGGMFKIYEKEGWPRASLTAYVDHLEHAIKIGGVDAVGLGTDFDGVSDPPIGFEDYSKLPKVIEELLRRGHTDAEVKKILGENFIAFFGRVEAAKKSLAKAAPSTATQEK